MPRNLAQRRSTVPANFEAAGVGLRAALAVLIGYVTSWTLIFGDHRAGVLLLVELHNPHLRVGGLHRQFTKRAHAISVKNMGWNTRLGEQVTDQMGIR